VFLTLFKKKKNFVEQYESPIYLKLKMLYCVFIMYLVLKFGKSSLFAVNQYTFTYC